MANSVIDTEMIVLWDNWPIDPHSNWGGPYITGPAVDSLGWEGQNVATAKFDLGRKFHIREDGGTGKVSGWSTFIYLRVATQNPDVLLSCVAATNKTICTPAGTPAENATTAATALYTVTNDGNNSDSAGAVPLLPLGMCAIATSAMTNNYYGWFWCGGVPPLTLLTGLVGDCPTANTVAIGEFALAQTDIGNYEIGFIVAADPLRPCGVATIADT
jgi:hypothetical protein